jgi:hypothetical protein
MSRFSVGFRGWIRTSLRDQDVHKRKNIINFHLCCESYFRFKAVEVAKKLLQYCWSMWPNHNVSSTYPSHLVCLWSAVSNTVSSGCSTNILLTTRDSEFPISIPSPLFGDRIYPQTGSTWLLNRCPVLPLRLQLVKVSVLMKKDPC